MISKRRKRILVSRTQKTADSIFSIITPKPIGNNRIDKDSALDSSEEEDLEYDSSSDFIPSDDEPDEDAGNHPPNPRYRRHSPRGNRKGVEQTQADAQRSVSRSVSPPPYRFEWRDAYNPENYSLCWENRRFIFEEYREFFEYEVFKNTYPELSQLHIPRARCEVIMAAHVKSKDSKASSKTIRSICSGSPKNESESLQRTDFSSSPQPKCFLNLLPLEVQLQILGYCLISEAPFLDFCFGYRFAASELARTARKGQDDVTLGILSTNRHFRTQGLRILWQQNTFLYTRSDEFTLLNTDRLMTLPQITLMRHLKIHQDCVWGPSLHHDIVMLNSILFAVSAAEQFPALQSLHLNLAHTDTRPYVHERRKRIEDILLEARYLLRDIRAGRLIRQLQKVTITGITDDDLGCLAVKLASFLVEPGEGRLEVGVGMVPIRRSWYIYDLAAIHGINHEMVYMSMEDVNNWVDWRRQQHRHLRKLFEWEDYFPVETRDPSLSGVPENDSGLSLQD